MAKKLPQGDTPDEVIADIAGDGRITNVSLALGGRSERYVLDEVREAFSDFVRALRRLGIHSAGSLSVNDGTPASGYILVAGDVPDVED